MAQDSRTPPEVTIHARSEEQHGAVVEGRILRIMKMMRALTFVTGKTVPRLAKEWGLSADRVGKYASEASNRVRAEVMDPDHVGACVGTALQKAIKASVKAEDWRTVGHLADTWAKIGGAVAPRRNEHTGRNGGPIPVVDVGSLTDEQLQRIYSGDFSALAGAGGTGVAAAGGEPDDVEDER